MTTNTESNKLGTPGRILIGAFCALMLGLGLWAGASHADAAPTVSVGQGDLVNDTFSVAGIPLPAGICTVTAVGRDDSGQKYAVFMGHCSSAGNTVNKDWFTPVGHIQQATFTVTESGQLNQIDVGIIRLNPGVGIRPSGMPIGAPQMGASVGIRGHGLWTPAVSTGRVLQVADTDFRVGVQASPGASGGPVIQNGQLVGMMSRGYRDYFTADTVAMRMDVAMRYVQSHFGVNLHLI